MQKSLEIKEKALPLHPQSEREKRLIAANERFLKIFWKKFPKKFGGFKNMIYLCTRNSLLKFRAIRKRFLEKFFEKSFQKIWWFQKFALPLQPLSDSKNWERKQLKMVLWFTGFLYWEKKCSIYLSISFKEKLKQSGL